MISKKKRHSESIVRPAKVVERAGGKASAEEKSAPVFKKYIHPPLPTPEPAHVPLGEILPPKATDDDSSKSKDRKNDSGASRKTDC